MGVDFVVGPGQRYGWNRHITLETLARFLDLDQRFWSVPSRWPALILIARRGLLESTQNATSRDVMVL
jgi:hypothetical protein